MKPLVRIGVVIGRRDVVVGWLFLLDRQLKCRASVLRVKGKRPANYRRALLDRAPFGGSLTESAVAVFVLHEIAQRSAPGPPGSRRFEGSPLFWPSGYERKTIRNHGVSPFLPLPNLSEYSREMRL